MAEAGAIHRGRPPINYPARRNWGWPRALLARLPWWRLEPHPEWIEPHWSTSSYTRPYAAGIPGELRLFYFPKTGSFKYTILGLESGVNYRAVFLESGDRRETDLGAVPPAEGDWSRRRRSFFRIYVLILQKV